MKPGLLAITALCIGGLGVQLALSQAATESILTHGLASSAGSSLGKTLGNALGNAAGQLGNKLGQQTTTVPAPKRPAAAKTTTSATPAVATAFVAPAASPSGSLISSIQGGVSTTGLANCTPATKPATTTAEKSDASLTASGQKTPASAGCAFSQDTNSHPAVINLPPAN